MYLIIYSILFFIADGVVYLLAKFPYVLSRAAKMGFWIFYAVLFFCHLDNIRNEQMLSFGFFLINTLLLAMLYMFLLFGRRYKISLELSEQLSSAGKDLVIKIVTWLIFGFLPVITLLSQIIVLLSERK